MLPADPGMPPVPRVVAPYAHTLWDAAQKAGLGGNNTLGTEDLPVEAYLDLLHRATQHAGPLFGWQLGQHAKPTTYGVNGILLLACPTLGEALQQVLRFESLVHDLGRSHCTALDEDVAYGWTNDWPNHPAANALVESVFAGIQTCAQWLVGKSIGPLQIELAHRTDDATAHQIALWSGAIIRWGAAENRVVFPASVLNLPIPQAHPELLPLLQQHANGLLQARHPSEAHIVVQVRQSISNRLGQNTVKLSDVAQDLHLSGRTLQRRLANAGVAFQSILDQTRHELARHYLSQSTMPVAEIGYLLGFQDSPAFHHAFKTWQGQGPGQYRRDTLAPTWAKTATSTPTRS